MSSIKKMLFVLTGLLVFVCLPVLAEEMAPKQTTLTTAPSATVEDQTGPTAEAPLTPEETVTPSPAAATPAEDTEKDEPENGEAVQETNGAPALTEESGTQESEDETTEVSEDSRKRAEVFVDSNALNSTISIELEREIVSGPGNKVLAVIPGGSQFRMITEAAEGSELMAVNMMVKTSDGAQTVIKPVLVEENAQHYAELYVMPENAEGISGAVFFGNAEETTLEEARAYVETTVADNIAKETIVNSEEKAEAKAAAEDTDTAENPALELESGANLPEVSEVSETPNTGIEDHFDFVALFLCTLMIAGVTLWSRKTID